MFDKFPRSLFQLLIGNFLVAAISASITVVPLPAHSQLDDANLIPAPAPRRDQSVADLRAHGVGSSPTELIAFLEKGLSKTTGLPAEPAEKCQLAIDAMARLALVKSQDAIPVLTQIASMELPRGVSSLLNHDLSKTSAQERENFRMQALRLLQYNAANALSLIGDPSATNVLRSVFSAEGDIGARIQYALCMASLGDTSGVDYLVQIIRKENRKESAAAAKAFTIITGQDFGYTNHTPARARRSKAKLYQDWWTGNRAAFRVDTAAVVTRRANPEGQTTRFEPRSTRDLLKLTSQYFDFNNTMKSADARKALGDAGASINPDLERIALDPMEDLDVRMEAMNWYFEANRTRAEALCKRLRKDENPEIQDKANTLLDQIREEREGPAATRLR